VEHPEEDVVALNFASAKNPGGGFLKGSQAQEESLARASAIYSCLHQDRVEIFYKENSQDKTCLYTHNIIYSPKVPVFKDDNDVLLDEPYCCSFITAPAVNASHAVERVGVDRVRTTMLERIDRVLGIVAGQGHKVVVLGAWGCGVFGNTVQEVAKYFRDYLNVTDAKYKNTFSHIFFAIPDQRKLVDLQKYFESQDQYTEAVARKLPPRDNNRKNNDDRRNYNNNNERKKKRLEKETHVNKN